MTLSYSNTFRDRLAFNAYHLPRSPFFMLMMVGSYLYFTFDAVVPAVRQSPVDQSVMVRVIAFIFVELLLALFIVVFFAVAILLSMISRKNKPLFCEKTITLGEEVFVSESQYSKSEVRWKMVQKLARTRKYIFMYVSQEAAIVIPRRAFESSTQWDAFYDICKQRTKSAGK